MIQVSKSEAKMIRETLPGVSVKRTVHKYYTEDTAEVRKALRFGKPRKGEIKCL